MKRIAALVAMTLATAVMVGAISAFESLDAVLTDGVYWPWAAPVSAFIATIFVLLALYSGQSGIRLLGRAAYGLGAMWCYLISAWTLGQLAQLCTQTAEVNRLFDEPGSRAEAARWDHHASVLHFAVYATFGMAAVTLVLAIGTFVVQARRTGRHGQPAMPAIAT
ncbi:MAG TPA: hypothetical protein VMT30_00625 [Candidatus Saccharimonadia bacterium]|nr:hypothetical protein [Candidatus Saccharimonadia bacterium]